MTERISLQETSKGFIDGLMKTTFYVKKSGLDLQLLEIINYRVSQINGCAYCLGMHHKDAIHMGETELRLHSLAAWRECPYYTEKERAALAFAEALTLTAQHDIPDHLFEALSNVFSKAEIADLTLAVTVINSWNRINKVFRPTPGQYTVGMYS